MHPVGQCGRLESDGSDKSDGSDESDESDESDGSDHYQIWVGSLGDPPRCPL